MGHAAGRRPVLTIPCGSGQWFASGGHLLRDLFQEPDRRRLFLDFVVGTALRELPVLVDTEMTRARRARQKTRAVVLVLPRQYALLEEIIENGGHHGARF